MSEYGYYFSEWNNYFLEAQYDEHFKEYCSLKKKFEYEQDCIRKLEAEFKKRKLKLPIVELREYD